VASVAERADVEVVGFDVNETLSDMAPMTERFGQVGAPCAARSALVRVAPA
jgi:hypothetical protein